VRPALRLSRCTHNKKHLITKGQLRFVVREAGPAAGEQGYCLLCAKAMLEQVEVDIGQLRIVVDKEA
jgi:hypothetical protein